MLRNLHHGPVIVNIRDTRIVLGRQEAERVLVKTARRNDDSTGI
jgi:Fe2+ transport system protein FeoA